MGVVIYMVTLESYVKELSYNLEVCGEEVEHTLTPHVSCECGPDSTVDPVVTITSPSDP